MNFMFLPREHKIHIFSPPCNILYIYIAELVHDEMEDSILIASLTSLNFAMYRPLRLVWQRYTDAPVNHNIFCHDMNIDIMTRYRYIMI